MIEEKDLKGRKLGCIYDFDRNDNDYNHDFFFIDEDGTADSTCYNNEFRKMEDVGVFECTLDEAIELGLDSVGDLLNYKE